MAYVMLLMEMIAASTVLIKLFLSTDFAFHQ